jgi:hypothetical protein
MKEWREDYMAAFLVFCIIGLYVFNKEATTEKLSDEVDWRAKGVVSLVLDEKTFGKTLL